MKADCSAKFLMWPKFAFYLEICDPTLNKRHLVIQKSDRSLKNMGSPAIAISLEMTPGLLHIWRSDPFHMLVTVCMYSRVRNKRTVWNNGTGGMIWPKQ